MSNYIQESEHSPVVDQKRFYLDWSDTIQACANIVRKIYNSHTRVDFIIAVPKGGFVPARIVSELLFELPIFSYNQQIRVEKSLSSVNNIRDDVCGIDRGCVWGGHCALIIDDICDSGKTFHDIFTAEKFFDYTTASVVQRDGSGYTPDFVGYKHSGPEWIVFPWEADAIKKTLKERESMINAMIGRLK